jgi:site-specific recombinase XerD
MASIYKRKQTDLLWIKYRDQKGRLVQESTGFSRKVPLHVRQAKALAAEKTALELRHGFGGKQKQGGWAWVKKFFTVRYSTSPLTLERYLNCWDTLQRFIEDQKIQSPAHLLRQHCYDYVTWRATWNSAALAAGRYKASRNTALLELKALRIALQEAVERGLIQANPVLRLGLKKDKPKKKPAFSDSECATIRAAIPSVKDPAVRRMLATSFEIARHQGCRLSETRLNPMTDVTLAMMPDGSKTGTITFNSKGSKEFATLLHPALVPLFEKLQAEHCASTWEPPARAGRQWASGYWWRFLNSLGFKSGTRRLTFHCNRVTVITEMARNNVPLSKAKNFVGHASTSVHEIYQRLDHERDLADCVQAVGRSSSTSGAASST